MKMKIIIFFATLVTVANLISGCTGDINETSPEVSASQQLTAPTYFKSFDDLNEYLATAKAFSKGVKSANVNDEEEMELNTAIDQWHVDEMNNYYTPTWIPEDASLSSISLTERYIAYSYTLPEFNADLASEHEHILNNTITFEWTRLENAEKLLENTISSRELSLVEDGSELYYHDYGTTDDPDTYLARTYYWLQDGYRFRLTLPLRVLIDSENTADIETYSSNLEDNLIETSEQIDLIGNSAEKIEL